MIEDSPQTPPETKSPEISKKRAYTFTVPRMPRPALPRSPTKTEFATPRPHHRRAPAGMIVLVLLTSLLSGATGAWLDNHYRDQIGGSFSSLTDQKKIVASQSQLISQIAKTVGPSVVSVNVAITANSSSAPAGGVFGFSQPTQEQAAGTGIIISDKGMIITNRHVVPSGTTKVSVTLSDGTELKDVSVLGRTSDSDSLDVAFLKINNAKDHRLHAAHIGDSAAVQVGDNVIAIGNALGQFQNTVTSGIISGFGRSVQAGDGSGSSASENLDNLFQTDAAINEGNSGGPLVDLNGQVIGINTAIAGGAQNIGFAIPINDVRGLIGQVLKTGKFARAYLGVRYIPLTADVASQFSLKTEQGAFIAPADDPANPSVLPDSPASKAHLQEKDVITAVNGTKVDQTHSLTSLLGQHQPGDKVQLTVMRNGKNQTVEATLEALPTAH